MTGPLREIRDAWERRDLQSMTAAIKTVVGESSDTVCWSWRRRSSHNGYPRVGWKRADGTYQNHRLHRLVAELAYGHVGTQHVHHICANRTCVNPAHLTPMSAEDNAAEMRLRTGYQERIRRLEQALAELAPSHPLLSGFAVLRHPDAANPQVGITTTPHKED